MSLIIKTTSILLLQCALFYFYYVDSINAISNDFCEDYESVIENDSDQSTLNELNQKYIKECEGSSAQFYYHIAKRYYELNLYEKAKQFMEAARIYSLRHDPIFESIRYYLIFIALETSPNDLAYIQDVMSDIWTPPKALQQLLHEKLYAKYREIIDQFCKNPVDVIMSENLIQLINIFGLGETINLTNCIKNEINRQEALPQTYNQSSAILILYKKLKQFNVNYENKTFQYHALLDYYEQSSAASKATNFVDRCQLFTMALGSLNKAMNKSDTENVKCKQAVSCLDTEILNAFQDRFQSNIQKTSAPTDFFQWKKRLKQLTVSCMHVVPEDFELLNNHMDIYISLTQSIDQLSFEDFVAAYNKYKNNLLGQKYLSKKYQSGIIAALIHKCSKNIKVQLTTRQPAMMTVTELNDKACKIYRNSLQTQEYLNNQPDLKNDANINELLSVPVSQSNTLCQMTQHLLRGDTESILSLKPGLLADIWTAWHFDDVLNKKQICFLHLVPPTIHSYNFKHYQIQSIPDIHLPGLHPEKCTVVDGNICKIKLPVQMGCSLSFHSEIQISDVSYNTVQQEIVLLKKENIKKNIDIMIPKNMFRNVCLTTSSPCKGMFKVYHCNCFAISPDPVLSFSFNNTQKCLDILPGMYLYSFDFNSINILDIWFETLNVPDRSYHIQTYVNQMNTEKRAMMYLNTCLYNINHKTFSHKNQQEYIAHSKGALHFLKYLIPWYCCQKNRTILWSQLINPLTRQKNQWQNHYRVPQIKELGVSVPEKKESKTCLLLYTLLDLMANQKPKTNNAFTERMIYNKLLNTVIRRYLNDNDLLKKLEDYIYE